MDDGWNREGEGEGGKEVKGGGERKEGRQEEIGRESSRRKKAWN